MKAVADFLETVKVIKLTKNKNKNTFGRNIVPFIFNRNRTEKIEIKKEENNHESRC